LHGSRLESDEAAGEKVGAKIDRDCTDPRPCSRLKVLAPNPGVRSKTFSAAAIICALIQLSGCANSGGSAFEAREGIFGSVFAPDLRARQPTSSGSVVAAYPTQSFAPAVYSDPSANMPLDIPAGVTSGGKGDVNLNFQAANLSEVVQAILGDALQSNYTIDPNVSGSVTLSTVRPIPKEDLLAILESVLAANGATLTKTGDLYQVKESSSVTRAPLDQGRASAGYGLSVVPLQYVSAQTLMRLIDGFATRPGAVKVEKTRNLLIIIGSGDDRRTAINTVLSFDTDWMRDQSVAILPLRATKPETIIPELTRVFGSGAGGSSEDVIQFMAMPRLKAVLAVSQSRRLVERAQSWVSRLDRENPDVDSNVQVYRVKYRDAQKLSELLNRLFSDAVTESENPGAETEQTEADPSAVVEAAFAAPGAVTPAGVDPAEAETAVLSGDGPRIQPDLSNNSLVIYADRETREKVLRALTRIDVPQLQVAVNVTMAEVRLNDQLRYGVQYFIKSQNLGLGRNKGSIGLFRAVADNIAREVPGFNFVVGTENSPDIVLNALDAITDVRVLSSPSLVVMENEVAKFRVGDQIPIITRTVTSVTDATAPVSNEVEYRDTGIIMNVRPRIAENGVVTMAIEQEISSVTANAGSLTPVISNRSVASSISVVDGQTVLLGGLISEQNDRGHDGIPGLNRLKVVGNLFGSRNSANTRTELLILIRPSVIRDSRDAQQVAEALRAQMWNMGGGSLK